MAKLDLRRNLQKYLTWFFRFVVIVLVVSVIFIYFSISTGANQSLRKAKNLRIALMTTDIEYYGVGKSIYQPNRRDGLTEGVRDRVYQLLQDDASYEILGYDKMTRTVTEFLYTDDHYQVLYSFDGEDEHWTVWFRLKVID